MHATAMPAIDHAQPTPTNKGMQRVDLRSALTGSLTRAVLAPIVVTAVVAAVVTTVGCGSVRGTDRPLLEAPTVKNASESTAPSSTTPPTTPTTAASPAPANR